MRISSKLTSERSAGTWMPILRHPCRIPSASMSADAKIAVGGLSRVAKCCSARSPACSPYSPKKTKSGLTATPALFEDFLEGAKPLPAAEQGRRPTDKCDRGVPVLQKMGGGQPGAATVVGEQARSNGARNVLVDEDDIAAGIDLFDQCAVVGWLVINRMPSTCASSMRDRTPVPWRLCCGC